MQQDMLLTYNWAARVKVSGEEGMGEVGERGREEGMG